MIGLITIGVIALLSLRKKRGVCGIGLTKFEWGVYRDLVDEIEQALEDYVSVLNDEYWDEEDEFSRPRFNRPRLDISVSRSSRGGYDFDVIIDDYDNFRFPNNTYDVNSLINEEQTEDNEYGINYEELDYIVNDLLDRKYNIVSGIGAVQKRRLYHEIDRLQPIVDFTLDYEQQSPTAKKEIEVHSNRYYNDIYPKRTAITPEKYFKQLKRAYNAISGIGETMLPFSESKVRNEYGDIILIHRDYGSTEQKLRDAIIYIEENYNSSDYNIGFWNALLAIASGLRFVWKSTDHHRGIEELMIGAKSDAERKKRISYLATPNKGGLYPEAFAHNIIQDNWRATDDLEILNGIIDAFREVNSVKEAKQIILDAYLRDHIIEEDKNFEDVPF